MSDANSVIGTAVKGIMDNATSLEHLVPKPQNRAAGVFKTVLNAVGSVASSLIGQGAGMQGIDLGYQEILATQIETQNQMQLVSLYSNIEKSKHETQMAAVRNVRVG